jgi:putative ABC transport system permease protein
MGLTIGNWNATGVEDEFDFQELPDMIDALSLVLMVLGGLSLGLSGFLIVNTMSAIVTQQVWQIGVMKAIGATFGRVARVYLAAALIYGLLALVLAVPLGAVGAHLLANWMLEIFNIRAAGALRVSPLAVGIQVAVGLAVPLLAASFPVVAGARVSPRRAISSYGLGGGLGRGPLDRLVGRIRRLPRPLALSLRNTFRRKARVALTLLTLAFVGVMFIMVMSVRVSLDNSVEALIAYWHYDVMVVLSRPYRVAHLVKVTEGIPDVTKVEVWDLCMAQLLLPGGRERDIAVYGRPFDSELFVPRVVSGRILLPNDGHAILLNNEIAADEGFRVGDQVRLDIAGRESSWSVVGLDAALGFGDSFVPFNILARETGNANRGSMVMVMSDDHDAEAQARLVDVLGDVYVARHIEAKSFMSADEFRERSQELFGILSSLLLAMAFLAAVVGGIGLTGTLSINVVERRREIGVMRAIGASSAAIAGVFVGEGLFLGLLSWLLAVPLSYPGARLFSQAVGWIFFDLALDFSYSVAAALLWLVLVLLLSALASLGPALRATRVSVREALAYE